MPGKPLSKPKSTRFGSDEHGELGIAAVGAVVTSAAAFASVPLAFALVWAFL
ncbi:hypothetical protein [Bradyrhizobium sp. LHD-71]|uniref:hypothetical protein n=1 Tax=Bradyrhizobium sp. LHD-71 TaxID=3072141 RepID=UPI00280D3651|nr:hypothetical protein [Bradyrhizobium sp. LHD-71]MDQ8727616.1 hypothetical protein [Bradyrhizobium sp. LHD-71]